MLTCIKLQKSGWGIFGKDGLPDCLHPYPTKSVYPTYNTSLSNLHLSAVPDDDRPSCGKTLCLLSPSNHPPCFRSGNCRFIVPVTDIRNFCHSHWVSPRVSPFWSARALFLLLIIVLKITEEEKEHYTSLLWRHGVAFFLSRWFYSVTLMEPEVVFTEAQLQLEISVSSWRLTFKSLKIFYRNLVTSEIRHITGLTFYLKESSDCGFIQVT